MVKNLLISGALLFGATIFTPALAETDDKTALLALAEKAFDAVNTQAAEDWRAIQYADGVTISFRQDPDGAPGVQKMRFMTNEEFLAAFPPTENDYREFWTSEPTVLIRGPIAVIWGEYEFTIDGAFSHCGVDSIDAVKVDGEWKIANFMWTVEQEGCRTTD